MHLRNLACVVAMSAVMGTSASCERVGSDSQRITQASHTSGGPSQFPDSWYFYNNNEQLDNMRQLVGKAPPALTVENWIGEPQQLSSLKGNVVVVEFWGTWCRPCMLAIPKNVQIVNDYRDQGLVFIGVHSSRSSDNVESVVSQKNINYSVAVDANNASATAWRVPFWPTYILIDRKGVVRAAGLEPGSVPKAVEILLNER